jgi:hypothetical protein
MAVDYGTALNTSTLAAYSTGGSVHTIKFRPGASNSTQVTIPTLEGQHGFRDRTAEHATEAIEYAAGTWTVRLRISKSGQTVPADIIVRLHAYVYKEVGGAYTLIGSGVSADTTISGTGGHSINVSFTTGSVTSVAAGGKIQVECYVQHILLGAPAAPAAAVNVQFRVDETEANSGAAFTAIPAYVIRYTEDHSVSGSATVALAKALTLARSLSVNGASTVSMSRVLSLARSMSVTGSGTTAFARQVSRFRSHSVTGSGTAAMVRQLAMARSLSVAGSGTVAMSRVLTLFRSLSVTGTGTAALGKVMVFARHFIVNSVSAVNLRLDMPQVVLNRIVGGGGSIVRKVIAIFDD